jgi:hypothetical protein
MYVVSINILQFDTFIHEFCKDGKYRKCLKMSCSSQES